MPMPLSTPTPKVSPVQRVFFFFLVYSCFFVFFDFGNPRPFARDSFIFRMLDDLRLWLLPQGGLVLLRGRNLLRGHGV